MFDVGRFMRVRVEPELPRSQRMYSFRDSYNSAFSFSEMVRLRKRSISHARSLVEGPLAARNQSRYGTLASTSASSSRSGRNLGQVAARRHSSSSHSQSTETSDACR